MKPLTIFAVLVVAIFLAGLSWGEEGKVVDSDKTVMRDGLWYEVDSDKPFTGTEIDYFPEGQKKAEVEFLNGIVHGNYIVWYANGQKYYDSEWTNGTSQGKYIFFEMDGRKILEGTWRDGMASGKDIFWHKNGQKHFEREHCDGKPCGKWIYWYDNGQIESKCEYSDGELVWQKCWDEEGKPIECDELPKESLADFSPTQTPHQATQDQL
jgi:antitoxin component YwqK of YwqJK toxin-antitoxin module